MFKYNLKDKCITLFKYFSYQTMNIHAKRRIDGFHVTSRWPDLYFRLYLGGQIRNLVVFKTPVWRMQDVKMCLDFKDGFRRNL